MHRVAEVNPEIRRVLGRVRGARPGPTLLCIGGLHGNEGAGVKGLEAVLEGLAPHAPGMSGDFVALIGNRTALSARRRFIDRDLNRAWTRERIELLRDHGSLSGDVEDVEQVELLAAIEEVVEEARGPVYVMDLHTTSGPGGPFSTFGDSLPNRALAAQIPVPMILGLEEQVDGTLLAFLGAHGMVAVAYESGQHEEPKAVDRAEDGIWLAVAAAGLVPEARLPQVARARKRLHAECKVLPRALEMRHRHDIENGDGFVMNPGYANFQHVREGEVVARDVRGEVRIPETSRILMPLYQEQGEDGFFLVREFSAFWLTVSSALRRVHADRYAHLLPGVRRDPTDPDSIVVNKRVARWFALQFFHLLGFRKVEDVGDRLVVRRRHYDERRFVKRGPPPEHLT